MIPGLLTVDLEKARSPPERAGQGDEEEEEEKLHCNSLVSGSVHGNAVSEEKACGR
jgi:hypothetical protein